MPDDDILERAARLKARGQSFVMATVVRAESPTSAKPGAKALVSADGAIDGWIGGGCAQPAVIDTAKKVLADGQARLIRVSPNKGSVVEPGIVDFGMTCHSGGTLDIFLEAVLSRPALVVIGSSLVARSLSALASRAGFAVHVAFPGAGRETFPEAVEVLDHLDLASLSCSTPRLVVVATQGKRDEAGLIAALETAAPYVAFVASARKAGKLKAELKQRGHRGTQVDAIVAPAGVEIGAVTPEEIAVSVLAGVIRAHREVPFATDSIAAQAPAAAAADPAAPETGASCCGRSAVEPPVPATASDSCCAAEPKDGSPQSTRVGAT